MSVKTYLTFVLDETGSMNDCLHETITGFNEYFDTLVNDAKTKYIINVVKFNSILGVTPLFQNTSVNPKLSTDNYFPSGMTPLYDAIGQSIRVAEAHKHTGKVNKLFIIMTDGFENASKEFTKKGVFDLIKEKEKEGWTFVYLGANQDAYTVGSAMGFAPSNTVTYDSRQTQNTLRTAAVNTVSYSSRASGQSVTGWGE